MNPRRLSAGLLLPWLLIASVATLLALLCRSILVASVDGRFYDMGITAQAKKVPDDIVLLGIDEKFMAGRHAYLAPRDRLAKLIDSIAAGNPSVIVLDVWLDSRIDQNPRGVDAQLREALLRAKQKNVPVLLSDFVVAPQLSANKWAQQSGVTAHGSAIPFFRKAAATGDVLIPQDADGICRHLPEFKPQLPPMPLQAALLHRKKTGKNLPDDLRQRLESELTPIDFCGPPGTIQVTPADKLLQEPGLAALYSDKVVFIGATYERSGDLLSTPYELKMFGVEVLAQATQTVLRGAPRHSHETPRVKWKIALVAFVIALGVSALALRGALWGIAAAVLFIIGSCALAVVSAREPIALLGFHYWPPSAFLLAAPLACGMGVAFRQMKQARELRLVRDAFGAYVGEDVLQKMGDKMPELGGETRDIAVLFCDIRGYSALSERLRDDPAQLMSTLNAHFEPLVQALQERGAYADNYVGDLLMALFGAPVSQGNLAVDTRNAVLAALDFVKIVNERNQARRENGEEVVEVGIGVHCGAAVVGNLGTQRKIHYTAIGDVVNIASRVESATRKYDVPLLITEETLQACATDPQVANLSWEFVDETLVKGREMPVRLYRCNGVL